METFRTFGSAQEARDYRYTHGTGGWIFVPNEGRVVLFPPEMTPCSIFCHALAKGQSGKLLANA